MYKVTDILRGVEKIKSRCVAEFTKLIVTPPYFERLTLQNIIIHYFKNHKNKAP